MFYSLELGVVAYTCDPVLRKGRQENQKSRDIFELWQVQDLQQETLSQKTGEQKRFAFITTSICFLSANTFRSVWFWKHFPDVWRVPFHTPQLCWDSPC